MSLNIRFSKAIELSLAEGKPVLALESTVITHGLPYPQNLEIARELQQIASDNNVTPATIVLIEGVVHIGLEEQDLEHLAKLSLQAENDKTILKKIAVRDIPMAIAEKWSGGTTVSATVYLSYLAGIKVFATGGIGGVHRFWQESFDISADLPVLAKYPVIVVTAGCKAILDIPATLEQLETLSVPVYGWQTDSCPAFYTKDSAYTIDRIDKIKSITDAYKANLELSQSKAAPATGFVVMNPIPSQYSIPSEIIEPIIQQAISEAGQLGVKGKAITPWLLQRLSETTKGKSVAANLELLKNNVVLGSRIASELN